MSNFNPMYDDGYFKCLLDLKKFAKDSEKLSIRGVRKQRNYISSFIELLLSNREARMEFMYCQEFSFRMDEDYNIIKYLNKDETNR